MSWKNVRLIFLREVRDQLRDRRTLFMVAVLPMLLYPALGIGMAQMMMAFSEQARNVVILGAGELESTSHSLPPLYVGSQFLPTLFADPQDADRLYLTTDGSHPSGNLSEADQQRIESARSQAARIHELADLVRRRTEIEKVLAAYNLAAASGLQIVAPGVTGSESTPAEEESANEAVLDDVPGETDGEPIDRAALEARIADLLRAEEAIKSSLSDWFRGSDIQVLVVIPSGFAESMSQQTQRLVNRDQLHQEIQHPIVLQNSADEKSQIAYRRVREAIDNWEHQILQSQLSAAGLPSSIDKPVDPTRVDLAQGEQISANLWSKMFPVLLVIMAVTGAFYPAIDLGAGEKERGTMETLLICPATRTEIVLGKFFTVMLFSMSTALLNIGCMAVTGRHMISSSMGPASALLGEATFPPLSSLAWLVVLAVPLSALFSSLSLAFAMFARSSKEGQYYLTPLLVVTMGLTFFCLNPGIEIDPFKSVMPVVGPALLLKSLLLATGNSAELLVYAVPVLVSSFAYCALGLWWAIEVFSKESVLFREAERFDLRLWIAHIFRDKDATPSFTEAAFCIVLILLLQFAAIPVLQRGFVQAILSGNNVEVLNLQTIYLIATVGTPAVMMSLLLTTHFNWTLKLHWPEWQYLVAALVLPFTLQPISVQLLHWLDWFFPPLPEGAEFIVRAISDPHVSLWWPLLAIAVAPAVCEELAFRGFILSGLQRSGRNWLAIVISALVFGLIHLVPQQQFNGALLGIVIGLLAVRSGSLLPGVLFHFLFNGTQVLLTRMPESAIKEGVLPKLVHVENGELLATWPTLVVCVAISAVLIFWLIKQPSARARPS